MIAAQAWTLRNGAPFVGLPPALPNFVLGRPMSWPMSSSFSANSESLERLKVRMRRGCADAPATGLHGDQVARIVEGRLSQRARFPEVHIAGGFQRIKPPPLNHQMIHPIQYIREQALSGGNPRRWAILAQLCGWLGS
jgi:hypothetical protein